MRTRLMRGKVTLLFMTLGLLLAIPAIVLADNLQDEVTANNSTKTIATGSANSWTNDYWIQETGGGSDIGPGNCDIPAGGSATFKLNVPSEVTATSVDGTNPDGSPKLVFNACGNATTNTKSVTFSSNTPGVYDISASFVSGTGGVTDTVDSGFNEGPANLQLTVFGVTNVTPADGATGVPVTENVTATFSGAITPSSLSTSTFKLVKDGDPTNTPIPATVTYDSTNRKATLDPSAPLLPGTKYNATVVGGASGVKSANDSTNASVALEQDKTWSFTTFNPNTAPVADGQSVSTNEDTAKTITLTGSDVDGNNLTFSTVAGQGPTNGSLGNIGPVTCTATTPVPKKNCSADVTYTPNQNFNGADSFKFRVNDGTVNSATDATVSITVNAVNDAPSFQLKASPDQTVLEDSGAQSVAGLVSTFSAGPANESGQAVDFIVTNDNNSLFTAGGQPAIDNTGKLTYTPAANAFGTATVTVKAHDDGGTANVGVDTSAAQSFTITVNAVNDAPSFTKGADETVNEDSGAHSVANWASAISAGPNESSQTLDFQVTNDNNALFTATGQPKVSASGTLTYTLAADANGTANVDVKLHDDGGTANGGVDTSATQSFKINVTAVNDAPSFQLPASPNQTVLLNAGAQSVSPFATNISAGPADEASQTVSFLVSNNNNSLFTATGQPAIDASGKLTYTLAQDAIGTATVSVQAKDNGGTANGGVDTSTPAKTFTIDVNYGFSGFLQPINWTAHQVLDTNVSTFKAGSTVPVKFYLTDANGNRVVQPVNAQWNTPQKGSATNQAIDESLYTDPATSGSLYRWDSMAQQYIYNWSTKGVAGGFYYKIGVTLPDGNTYYTYISLR